MVKSNTSWRLEKVNINSSIIDNSKEREREEQVEFAIVHKPDKVGEKVSEGNLSSLVYH